MQLGYVCVTIYARWEGTGISSRFLRLRGVNVGKGEEMERWGEEGRGRLQYMMMIVQFLPGTRHP